MSGVEPSPSPLLTRPGAVASPANGLDAGTPWHFGDPLREQRQAATAAAVVDRSGRAIIAVEGAERLSWLHTISSQHVSGLGDGQSAENTSLDANGRVEHHFTMTDLGGVCWIDTEHTHGASLLTFLTRMVFWAKVSPRSGAEMALLGLLGPTAPDVLAAAGLPVPADPYQAAAVAGGGFVRRMPWPHYDGFDLLLPRHDLEAWWDRLVAAGAGPAGSWAYEALRVEAVRARIDLDTDERTIPHEVNWIGGIETFGAVHLDKGCYRGQETVARVHNLGKPPRRLVLLHLDGSADGRPEPGDDVTAAGRAVGRVGTVVDHYELGPIALALIKRAVPADAALDAGPCAASIDPDSYLEDTGVQAGRAAIDRLRGR